ncbi:MAG: TolC family protein [candidate division Zixibacteria bacterium]|nr:TolC family protein [candidate division Zixibacteria bacterium]
MKLLYQGIVTALMAVLILGIAAQAAVLTLDDAIEMALKNRAAIIAARGQADLANAGKRAALGAFLPRVDASYDWYKTKYTSQKAEVLDTSGSLVEVEYPDETVTSKSLDFGGQISFTLPDAVFNYLASREEAAIAKLDVIGSEQDMILSVKTRYYAYLAAEQNVGVQEEAVKRSEEQLKLIQSRFELGSAAKSDVLKQRVQYGNDQLNLLQAKNSVISTKASLAYTIGLDPSQEHQFSTEYIVREYTGTLDEALQFGLTHSPSVLSAEQAIQAARYRFTNAKSDYLPKVSPLFSYGYGKDWGADDTWSSGTAMTYGVTLSWNIFDGFQRERNVTSSRVSFNNARAAANDQRNLTSSEIKATYLELEQLREQKRVSGENVEAATEDLKITQEKYNLGAATILDLLNAQVSLKQAQVSLIQADFDLNLSVARLENSMGKM